MMRFLLIAMAALATAACATTSDEAMPVQTMAATDSAWPRYVDHGQAGEIDGDEVVCRVDSPTGTRIRQPVCRTQHEWDEMQREGQRLLEHRQTGSATTY